MGRPKAFLPFGGELLLERVVRRVAEVAAPIVVVAGPGQELPPLPRDVVIGRDPVSGRGPLAGIEVGLELLGARASAAFVSATDTPFLEPALVRRLAALLEEPFDAVVPFQNGHAEPLCAVYACSLLAEIQALLAADRLAAHLLARRSRTRHADTAVLLEDPLLRAADPELRSLRNVNTPEDYAAALAEDAGRGASRA